MGDLENGWTVSDPFPALPINEREHEARLAAARSETLAWDDPGQTRLGFAMSAPDPVAVDVWADFARSNTNNVGVHTGFGAGRTGTRRLEREAVLSLAGLYHADAADGHVTSGATEAVIQGLRIGRNAVRRERGEKVVVLTGEFAHHSVAKAAEILDLELEVIPARRTWAIEPEDLDAAVDKALREGATGILVVATAGYYNSGLHDPIDELSSRIRQRALENAGSTRYFFYVDAAHGGFIYPFTDPDLPFDFRNSGVHAMSVDPHKSGLLPYACGVLLVRKGLISHVTAVAPTTGIVDETLIGSRPGAAAAALWSVLRRYARSGFEEINLECMRKRADLTAALLAADPACDLVQAPAAPVVCAAFSTPDGRLAGEFEQRYRLVPISAPGPDGSRRLYYHFYAGHSLTDEQIAAFRQSLAEAVRGARAAVADAREAGPETAGVVDTELSRRTDCFRHHVVHPTGHRDPDGPGYSFHTFVSRRQVAERLESKVWGRARSGRVVSVYAPRLSEPFEHEFFGVRTDQYSLEVLDRFQQKLSLVGAIHFQTEPSGSPGRVLINFQADGSFRALEYKLGAGRIKDEVHCHADGVRLRLGKSAGGVRRPHTDDYSFSIDTSLECGITWVDGARPPRIVLHRHASEALLPRTRHLPRESYRRFPNRFFDDELELEAGAGFAGRWRLSDLPTGHGGPLGRQLVRSDAEPGYSVDVLGSPGGLRIDGRLLDGGSGLAVRMEPRLGARVARALPSLEVDAPETLDVDRVVGFAEDLYNSYQTLGLEPRHEHGRWTLGRCDGD